MKSKTLHFPKVYYSFIIAFALMMFTQSSLSAQTCLQNNKMLVYNPSTTNFNRFYDNLRDAFIAKGMDVTVTATFPASIVSAQQDPINGYGAFFMFGNEVYSATNAAILNTYLSNSGRVFITYEVVCCNNSATAAASYANSAVAGGAMVSAYVTPTGIYNIPAQPNTCGYTLTGSAHRLMDNVPVANQILTASSAVVGFKFSESELNGGKGAIVGLGDLNVWYNGGDPAIGPSSSDAIDWALNCALCIDCEAGTAAPILTATTKTSVCPTTTVDLTTITATNLPANTTLTWHTGTPATTANKITGTAVATSGTYYAAFYHANADCYSGTSGSATTAVTVTLADCVTGTIDCSKTQIFPAPVTGVASQHDLVVTINVTVAGCFTPITVSGSGMSVANGATQVCTTTTGVQTFHIPIKYDGTTILGTMNFTVGSATNAGSCSANLALTPKKAIADIWTLECVPTVGPTLK
jgi:hypothetical protein